ncbi:hypothetical protein L226DRAFT_530021 [Lentinus tigrinus ALCF2SS1-7]|uniref:uncharacterized protein n=1 Tax=Lentinus tigrinus ALCF2SS1-7 TaxID=1328758 RepID=UPI0011660091|nr:hypothetical protein L226DRAFT_530021 [Lentinus tigrinus ALCF2SS1-7]
MHPKRALTRPFACALCFPPSRLASALSRPCRHTSAAVRAMRALEVSRNMENVQRHGSPADYFSLYLGASGNCLRNSEGNPCSGSLDSSNCGQLSDNRRTEAPYSAGRILPATGH